MILVITNKYFQSSHPNALRMKSMVKALCNRGLMVHVLEQAGETSQAIKGEYGESIYRSAHPDWSLLQKGNKTSRLQRWIFRMRYGQALNEFIGLDALPNLKEYALVISTGPSFNTFSLAYKLKKLNKSKWIADYRDLWSGSRIKRTHLSRQLLAFIEKRIESSIVPHADCITTATTGMAHSIKDLFPKKNIQIINNGYDEELDFIDFSSQEKDKLIISYLGNIYPNQDSDNKYINSAIDICSEMNSELRFVGTNLLRRGIKENTCLINVPWQNQEGFNKELCKAHAFIHFTPKGVGVMATTKIYPYLRSGKPLILVDPEKGELLDLSKKCKNIYLVNSRKELRNAILNLNERFNDGSIFQRSEIKDEKLSRKYQSEKMVELIVQLL